MNQTKLISVGLLCQPSLKRPLSLKRLDGTVRGNIVMIAYRLQSISNESQIVLPETCYQKIKESFNCVEVGALALKNKAKKVKIYDVLEWIEHSIIKLQFR